MRKGEFAMRAQNLTLLTDLYELTMMQGYYENPSDQIVVFDAFYRKNPCGGAYAVCAGLEQVIEYVRDLHFSPDDIDYLRSLHIFNDDFLEYFRNQLRKHDPKWEFVYFHFSNFVHGKCTFEELDIDLCNKFREYLLTAKKLKRNGHITRNSASGYWSTFRGLLKILYRNGLIRNNVNDFLEKIETEDVVKDYLSVEELYKLAETPCKKPVLKTASLFSCMTSLRISDILALCWEDIVDYSAGGKCVHIITKKNRSEDIIPISEEALDLIGYSPDKRGMVFKGLQRCWTQTYMKGWIRSAGITKKITFHSYRRTFATLQAAAGTDIRTIQSMMAHKSITTTQRYMKVVDSNKREASKKITLTRKD